MTTQDKIDILKEYLIRIEMESHTPTTITKYNNAKQWLAELENENNQIKLSNSGQVYYND